MTGSFVRIVYRHEDSRQVSARVSKSQLAEVGERQREPVPLTPPHCHIASKAVICLFCLFMSCFVLLYLFCCCGLVISEGQLRLVSMSGNISVYQSSGIMLLLYKQSPGCRILNIMVVILHVATKKADTDK